MMRERRRFERIEIKLDMELSLYDTDAGENLTDPAAGTLCNISRGGGVLELSEVLWQGKHLFFDPLESDSVRYNLTLYYHKGEQVDSVEISAEPVWFNRNMESGDRSFMIGVKFREKLARDVINTLTGKGKK